MPYCSQYASSRPQKLVTSGTYALVRHPGVMWLAIIFVSLLLLFPSKILLLAALVWLGVDVLHVFIQDKFLFPKAFADYPKYRAQTPFLIPTRKSFRACLRTFGRRGIRKENN